MSQEFIERFRAALRIRTDGSGADNAAVEAPLTRFQEFLAASYPVFHRNVERWVLSPYSLVYRWPGTAGANDKDRAAPVLLMGHYDVVPAEAAKWSADPFGAEFRDGYIYGRGAVDMKNIVMALMESAENLCRRGFKPGRDIWIVLGGDEERTGAKGARETAKWFSDRGIQFAFILDEGTPVAKDMVKGVDKPLALIGIEEKGYLSLDLAVDQKPGHASQPPEQQAAAVLGRALLRLSRKPFPWHLTQAVEVFFKQLSLHTPGITGFVMKRARLFGPLFFKVAATGPLIRALFRTTLAMTQLEGSAAENVMPSSARAVINLRLLPPWTEETTIARVREIIADERVRITIYSTGGDPVEAEPAHAAQESPGWKEIKTALGKTFPDVPALSFLMMATTDSRHYRELSRYIFRFDPVLLNPEELSRIHGHDERISPENLEHCLGFYTAVLEQL